MENRTRLEIQIKQVKSLLSEFRKTKMKCLQLCEKLNKDLPNLLQYQVLEVTCTRKIDSFDLLGVIKLKKDLLANLNEIAEAERDMTYEAQKNSFKKVVKAPVPVKLSIVTQNQEEQMVPFEVPSYESKNEPNQNKVDRLANFILALGKSMTVLRKCILGEWQWDEENFYKYEPQYLDLTRRLEQFKMRDEELVQIIEGQFQQQLQVIFSKGEKQDCQVDDEYTTIKIPKKVVTRAIKGQKESKRADHFQMEKQYHPVSMIEPKRKVASKKMPLEKINEEKGGDPQKFQIPQFTSDTSLDLHTTSFQKQMNYTQSRIGNRLMLDSSQIEDGGQNGNYVYMVKRISPDSQLNSSIASSISSLRSMRKKVFDDDIWDEFQKI